MNRTAEKTAESSSPAWLGWDRNFFARPFWQKTLIAGASRLPRPIARFLAWLLSWIFLFLLTRERRAAIVNLRQVLGPDSFLQDWRRARRVFFEWGLTVIEAFSIHVGRPSDLSLQRSGRPFIEQGLAQGKGVILVTCHLGSWHVAAKVLEEAQLPLTVIMRPEPNPTTRAYLENLAAERRIRFLYVGEDITTSVQALKTLQRNEVLAIQADRMIGTKGIEVDFFGKKTRLPLGPALLSWLSGAPMIPAVAVRTDGDFYQVTCFGSIVPRRERENRDQELERLTQKVASHLESMIRQYPYQWFNFHSVWSE